MIGASLKQGSAYAAMLATGSHGVRFQYNYTGDIAGLPGKVSATAPRWLRLTRTGATITGYESANGAKWTSLGSATLAAAAYGANRVVRHLAAVPGDLPPLRRRFDPGRTFDLDRGP